MFFHTIKKSIMKWAQTPKANIYNVGVEMNEQEQKKLEKYLGKIVEAERKNLDYLLNNAYSEQYRIVRSMNTILNIIIAADVTSFLYLSKEHFFYLYKIDSCIGNTIIAYLGLFLLCLTLGGSFIYAVWGACSSIDFMQSKKARFRYFPEAEVVETAGAKKDDFCVKKLLSLIAHQREAIERNEGNIKERQGNIIKLKDRTSYAFILFIIFLTLSGCIILRKEWSLSMAQDKNETTSSQTTPTDTVSPADQSQKELDALVDKVNSYKLPSEFGLESDTSNQGEIAQLLLENTNKKDN